MSRAVIGLHLQFCQRHSVNDTASNDSVNDTACRRTTSGGEKSATTHSIVGATRTAFVFKRHSVSVSNHTQPGVDCRFIRARDRLESEKGITHSDWRRPYIIINDTSRVG